MNDLDRYVHAATRDNTRRSYQSAIEHFEVTWGGFLPATADSIARYLVDHASTHSVNTLKQRLAALAQWHVDQGFPDPTKTPFVKKVLKGIKELHPAQEKQAKPLPIEQLATLITWIDTKLNQEDPRSPQFVRLTRDRALILLGFWRGFRSDELCRLQVEHVVLLPGQGMTLYLPRSKGDRDNRGRTLRVPALQAMCPVTACQAWLELSGVTEGPLFRRIDRWGNLSPMPLHANSIIALLRDLFRRAGLPNPECYSSHSLRRGFATWANASGWDLKALMEYVGWKDVKSAIRYIEATAPFASNLVSITPSGDHLTPMQEAAPWPTSTLELLLCIENYHAKVRGEKKARDHIERICLKRYAMRCLDRSLGRYRVAIEHESPAHLDRIINDILTEMQQIADSHQCFIEAWFEDRITGRRWD